MQTKITLLLIIILMTMSSCKVKSYREKHSYYFDLSDQLNFIESNIINSDNNKFTIEILFAQTNLLKSEVIVKTDSVIINTVIERYYQKTVDTTFCLSKKQLLEEINYQKNNTKNLTVIAGVYQYIKISKKSKEIIYPTTRVAYYLMDFLENGEIHY